MSYVHVSVHQASLSFTISLSLLTHVRWVSDIIQPSHPLLSPSPAPNLSQHQGLFQWVSSSQQVAKALELVSIIFLNFQFSRSVVSDSVTPWIVAHQASCPSPTPRVHSDFFMSIESMMPSSHLILCCPFLIHKGMIKPQETPCSRASAPKPESVLWSHLHLWLYRGLSPITISLGEEVNLQLQVNKNSWAWQECFSLRTPLKVI